MYKKIYEKFKNISAQNPITPALIRDAVKARPFDLHKGTAGRLAVCAGSKGLTGAACLASTAAIKSGCGMVTLCCAEDLNTIYEIKLTEIMTKPVKSENGIISSDASGEISVFANNCNAFLCGPGLSQNNNIKKLVFNFLNSVNIPTVLDADALNVISENTEILKKSTAPLILTPHIGEFSRMTGLKTEYILNNQRKLALDFAGEYGVVLVLKSHNTIVTDGSTVYENTLGNSGMAKGGTGDVLSGIIASFLAQGNALLTSALAGVYIHSLAADIAILGTNEYSLIPGDIITHISDAITNIQNC